MTTAIEVPLSTLRAERRARSRIFWSYAAIIGFVLFTALLVLAHGGALLNFGFPLLATSLAGALFIYRRSTYIAFTWWIWLFSPEVRRLVDFQTHFHTVSPVMLSPLLVTIFALIAVLRRPRILIHRSILPFSLVALVTLLAFVVGVLNNGFLPSAYQWGSWLEPLFFGIFLIADTNLAQENRRAFLGAAMIGLMIVAGYGIYQFFNLPPWDAAWINNAKLTSEGSAFAEQLRTFGPLNDSGAFAAVLTASLVFMFVSKGPLRIVAGALGFPALALSQERAWWGAWAIATVFIAWGIGGKARLRIIFIGAIVAAIAVPIISVGPIATLLTKRFATVSNVQNDQSAQAREALYESFIFTALAQPIGNGFGALGVAAKLNNGQNVDFDSGLLELPFTFGWVGGMIFLWSIVQISFRILANYLQEKDPVAIAASGLFFAMLAVLLFGQIFQGPAGLITWTAAALALGGPVARQRTTRLARS
jgi:hypothetical protein